MNQIIFASILAAVSTANSDVTDCDKTEWTWDRCRSGGVVLKGTDDGDIALSTGGQMKTVYLTGKKSEIVWYCDGTKEHSAWSSSGNYDIVKINVSHKKNDGGLISFAIHRCRRPIDCYVDIDEQSCGECSATCNPRAAEPYKAPGQQSCPVKVISQAQYEITLL
eukprot:Pgem_evm2s13009